MARNNSRETTFRFKQFSVANRVAAMKVGTDAVLVGSIAGTGSPKNILDIGTGTGILSLMLAQRFPDANLLALEIDSAAAAEASSNFAESPWSNRLRCECCDFTVWDCGNKYFDLIVSNPPYFNNGLHAPDHARALARHCGTLSYQSIIARSNELLSPEGTLALVGPSTQLPEIIYEAALKRLYPLRIFNISSVENKPSQRFVVEFTRADVSTTTETLAIRDSDGKYTEAYVNLTNDFYIKL